MDAWEFYSDSGFDMATNRSLPNFTIRQTIIYCDLRNNSWSGWEIRLANCAEPIDSEDRFACVYRDFYDAADAAEELEFEMGRETEEIDPTLLEVVRRAAEAAK